MTDQSEYGAAQARADAAYGNPTGGEGLAERHQRIALATAYKAADASHPPPPGLPSHEVEAIYDATIPDQAVAAAEAALQKWFHGNPEAPYTASGHSDSAEDCAACGEAAEVAVKATLSHLPVNDLETATRLGHALGRAEAAEEIAAAVTAYDQEWSANTWRSIAARIAREHGKAKA